MKRILVLQGLLLISFFSVAQNWSITGNNGINAANNFLGTLTNQSLRFRVNNSWAGELHPVTGNVMWGLRAGQSSTGFSNIGIGTDALRMNKRQNIVAIGDSALFNNGNGAPFLSNGTFNTAIGSKAMYANVNGSYNTAVGFRSLMVNDGSSNTAVGTQSLLANTTGNNNTAIGVQSMTANTIGSNNVGTGTRALGSNTVGHGNAATGNNALGLNTSGSSNTAHGSGALFFNATGSNNTAIGSAALFRTTNSHFNTAVGMNAGVTFDNGWNNTIVGANADVNQPGLFNCVAIGESARCTGSSQVRLGNPSTVSIGGFVGFSNISDGRYKKNIQEQVKGLEFIMKLRPVTYQMDIPGIYSKLNIDSREKDEMSKQEMAEQEKKIISGFVAQEVEEAAKATGYDFSGVDKPANQNDLYSLRYSEFVVPLVKAIQEQQQTIEELKKINAEQKSFNDALLKRLDKLETPITRRTP